MECPHCNKYISSSKTHCNYCGGRIEKNLIRRFWGFLSHEEIIEKQFNESLTNGNLPVIRSTRELELYIRHKVQDEEAAVIISDAFEQAGREAVFEIKRGGDGKPYKIEYIPNELPSTMSRKEVKDRIEQLLQRMRNKTDLSQSEKDTIQWELAQLARYHVIIWVNSSSKEGFEDRKQLIMDAMGAAMEGLTRRAGSIDSI